MTAPSTAEAAATLRRSGRLAAFLYALGAVYMLSTAGQLSTEYAQDRIWAGALAAAATGAVLLVLPWSRLPAWTGILPPLWAFVVLAGPIGWYAHALSDYLLLYSLLFSYVGMTQRQGACVALLPVALLTLLAAGQEADPPPPVLLVAPVVVAVVLGEALAYFVGQHRRAQDGVTRLLTATAALQAATTSVEAADVLTDLCRDLLDADGALVLRRKEPSSTVLVDVGTRPPDAPPVELDLSSGPSGAGRALAEGRPLFVADAGGDSEVHHGLVERLSVGSALFLPLGSQGVYEGVAVTWFTRPRRRIDALAQRAAEVLATQAGQALRRLRESEALEGLALTDPLTGLANRRALFSRLTSLQAGDCLVFLDLDHFKAVNDRYGHQEGDGVLRSFALALLRVVREQDVVARYGGEEFAVVLSGTDADGALEVVARLRERWRSDRPGTTFSAGVAEHGARSATETLAAADAALYEAKRGGRDTVRVADDGTAPRAEVLRLERRHRRA